MLREVAASQVAPYRQVVRARALLAAADGVANDRIAADLGVSPTTVRAWRGRFAEEGVSRLGRVRSGRGRRPSIPAETVEAIVAATLLGRPAGQTHWSCRTMAEAFGVSPSTVQRIWQARGLKPLGPRPPRPAAASDIAPSGIPGYTNLRWVKLGFDRIRRGSEPREPGSSVDDYRSASSQRVTN